MDLNEDSSRSHPDDLWISAGQTNTVILSQRETSVAKAILSETLQDVERLEVEIAHASALPVDLVMQRDQSVARANNIRTAIAPHKRVPPEVLAEIFVHTVEGTIFTLPLHTQLSWPWPLRRVCSLWRHIAISESRLWSSIEVVIGDWSRRQGRRLSNVLRQIRLQFPAGSGPSTLKFHVNGYAWIGHGSTVKRHPITYLLFPFLPFIRTLDLVLPISWSLKLFKVPALNLTCLETLSLSCGVEDIDDSHSQFQESVDALINTSAFCVAPSLRRLQVADYSYLVRPHGAPFPWAQLTDLDLSNEKLPPVSALHILRQCARLVTCQLRTVGLSNVDTIMKDEIFLPYLQSMAWARYHEDDHVFECLFAPSLQELHVFSWGVTEFSSLSTVQIFQYDSGDDLLHVASSLKDILSGMPNLVEFETSLEIPMRTLQKVLHGELLPFLEVMKCGVAFELADVFIDVFEKGLQNGAALRGRLREVRVQLTAMPWRTSPPESAMRHAERITSIYGIDFRLERAYRPPEFSVRRRLLV